MHDSLSLANISRMRPHLRRLTETAAKGSFTDLIRLRNLLQSFSESELTLCLPCLFHQLDPADIPNPDDLDIILSSACPMPRIDCAFVVLDVLHRVILKVHFPDTYQDFWLRVWPWIDFIHTYAESLPITKSKDASQTCISFSAIISALTFDAATKTEIQCTPGVRRFLAYAWKTNLQYDPCWAVAGGIQHLLPLLYIISNRIDEGRNFEEILDGVGGSSTHLARTIVMHLDRGAAHLCRFPDYAPASLINEFMGLCMRFVGSPFLQIESPSRLHVALQDTAFPAALVGVIIATRDTGAVKSQRFSLVHLIEFLKTPPGYTYIVQALDAGLLRAIIMLAVGLPAPAEANIPDDETMLAACRELLEETLPRATIHHRVVSQLKRSFPDAENLAQESAMSDSPISREWHQFVELVKERLRVFDVWQAPSRVSLKSCDNIRCGKIGPSHSLKCCGRCRKSTYCCLDCQRLDWLDGHAQTCGNLLLCRFLYPDQLTVRATSFLRALVTDEYLRSMLQIAFRQVVFMHAHPDEPFLTNFEFVTPSGVQIEVLPQSVLRPADELEAAIQLPTPICPKERSGQRMEVHVVGIHLGRDLRRLLLPMHTETAKLQDGLLRAVELIPPGKTVADMLPQVMEYLDNLISDVKSDILLTH
ncbi:hypothetical protein C8R43DRAFT_1031330 [Mycena crocata]|nr:hypothetical protein C8R43DRAFT_1031330 [Mycena crocata]